MVTLLQSLLLVIVIYIVGVVANGVYRVMRHGESVSEALGNATRWPVGAASYLRRKVTEWWENRNNA